MTGTKWEQCSSIAWTTLDAHANTDPLRKDSTDSNPSSKRPNRITIFHSVVFLMHFFPSSNFHFVARMYCGIMSGKLNQHCSHPLTSLKIGLVIHLLRVRSPRQRNDALKYLPYDVVCLRPHKLNLVLDINIFVLI